MRAIVMTGEGGVHLRDVANLTPNADEVLVEVKANALNRADLLILNGSTHGNWKAQAGGILGLEWAGVIVETGSEVTEYRVGDRVMGSGGSAFAEYVVPKRKMYRIPPAMSYEQAASMPIALQTMHDAIVTHGAIQPGATVMVQGASSAVAVLGMQIAKHKGAGKVIGTSRSDAKCKEIVKYGADVCININDADWIARALEETGGKGADLLIDFLAGPYMNTNLELTKVGGRLINIGRVAGEQGMFDFDLHNMRRIYCIGLSFRLRTQEEGNEIIERASRDLYPLLEKGALSMPIDSIYPFEEAAAALEHMKSNRHFGKIVLQHG